jgi:hypothetical protein
MKRAGGIVVVVVVVNALCMMSLAVCLAGAVLWMRSYSGREGIYWNFAEREGRGRWCDAYAYVFRGGLNLGRNRYDVSVWGPDGETGLHYHRSGKWTAGDDRMLRQAYGRGALGFEWLRWRPHDAADFDFAMLRVPLWAICVPTALAPLRRARRRARSIYRLKRGRCVDCGYDLRATPGRCPECGAMAAVQP